MDWMPDESEKQSVDHARSDSLSDNNSRTDSFNNLMTLLSVIILLAGINVAILINKWSRFLGVFLAIIGGIMLYYFTHRNDAKGRSLINRLLPVSEDGRLPIISERLVHLYTFKGRFPILMPITGILFIVVVFAYNLHFTSGLDLGSNDFVMLLLGGSIITYNYVPKKYSVERDFVLMFFSLLFLIVVIPTTYYSIKYDTTSGSWDDENPNSPIISYLLVKPLVFILKIFDVQAVADGVDITFWRDHKRMTLSIALGCTGLYSVSIFLSAFISFIMVEYRKLDQKVGFLLLLGIVTSYFANLLRMTVIILVGYHYGMDALIWTHENAGELIFMFWIAIFWGLMFRYLEFDTPWDDTGEKSEGEREIAVSGAGTGENIDDSSETSSGHIDGTSTHGLNIQSGKLTGGLIGGLSASALVSENASDSDTEDDV